jgi:hypothetical protein
MWLYCPSYNAERLIVFVLIRGCGGVFFVGFISFIEINPAVGKEKQRLF